MDYRISIDSYEGPIDSLHSLIRDKEIDIVDVSLAQILEEYLEWVKTLTELDLDTIGDFLAIAAHLLLMKVRVLLPVRKLEAEEALEDDLLSTDFQHEMIQQYRTFRELAEGLAVREKCVLQHYSRPSSYVENDKEDGEEVSFLELLRALKSVIAKAGPHSYVISMDEANIESRVEEILKILTVKGQIIFQELFSHQTSRIEIIVTFMAILELVRVRKIDVQQKRLFDDIWIHSRN